MRFTISKKLFVFLVLPGLLFFSLFIYFSNGSNEKIMYSMHRGIFSTLVKNSAGIINDYFTYSANKAETTAFIIKNFNELTAEELRDLLVSNVKSREFITGSTIAFAPYVFDKKKKLYSCFVYKYGDTIKTVYPKNYDYTKPEYLWYNVPLRTGKPYWTEPYLSSLLEGIKMISYSTPIIKDGRFIGVVTVDFDLDKMNDRLQEIFDYRKVNFTMISRKGKFIANPDKNRIFYFSIFDTLGAVFDIKNRNELGNAILSGKVNSQVIISKNGEDEIWGFYAPIPAAGFHIIILVSEKELNEPIRKVFVKSWIFFFIAAASILFLLIFITNKSVKPIKKLQEFAGKIRDGIYDDKIEISASDEISDLADNFNVMCGRLKQREGELKKINAELEDRVHKRTEELLNLKEETDKIIDTSPLPIALAERNNYGIIRSNPAMAEFHKIGLDELYETNVSEWYWNDWDREAMIGELDKNGKIIEREIEVKRLGGRDKRWVLVSVFPINYLNKESIIVEFMDITEIKEANIKINEQNIEISRRNKYIMDSISYASRIQKSTLPEKEYIKKIFPKHFIFYLPKDVVSGDFYWFNQIGNLKFAAAVDCTGHGVPGALMSMVGNTLLNEIIILNGVAEPGEILNELNARLIKELNKEGGANPIDGMDIALCAVDAENHYLDFAGAYRPLYYFSDGKFNIAQGVRKSIGEIKKADRRFRTERIKYDESITFYLFTDGFPDQNNREGKKFGRRKLKELLTEAQTFDIEKQYEFIAGKFNDFMGEEIQRDDISFIGISLSSDILLQFEGAFDYNKMTELSEKFVSENENILPRKIIRAARFSLNELMQNIYFYSSEKTTADDTGAGKGKVIVRKENDMIIISASNRISKDAAEILTAKIEKYNSLSTEGLKELSKKIRKSNASGSRGGGIGLIEIARKTGTSVDYKLENNNITITVKFNLGDVNGKSIL